VYPPELPRVDYTGHLGVVGAGLECRVAARASHTADALDEPPRRQRRVAKHPQLATSRITATQRQEAIARAERWAHRVLDDGEPAQWPASQRMVWAHPLRVG
jgi:hypothetical protein